MYPRARSRTSGCACSEKTDAARGCEANSSTSAQLTPIAAEMPSERRTARRSAAGPRALARATTFVVAVQSEARTLANTSNTAPLTASAARPAAVFAPMLPTHAVSISVRKGSHRHAAKSGKAVRQIAAAGGSPSSARSATTVAASGASSDPAVAVVTGAARGRRSRLMPPRRGAYAASDGHRALPPPLEHRAPPTVAQSPTVPQSGGLGRSRKWWPPWRRATAPGSATNSPRTSVTAWARHRGRGARRPARAGVSYSGIDGCGGPQVFP
mmetsp:Transcript_12758/g.32351  ORF Transcript_12758/g.32351 Transcript_12758/m.32351 type:complete len:270 (-) Transcript_12758:16-825(-)